MLLARVLRCALFAIVTVAIWTLSRPAFAMPAPLCDDRGATSLAQPPTLQATELAVLRAAAPATCDDDGLSAFATLAPGHGEQQVPSPQVDPVLPACATPFVSLPGEPIALPPVAAPSAEGVQFRVERPPRG